jgi:SAM-dependent methyltransferase
LFRREAPALVVPPQFNRNSAKVTALMPPEESGRWLLERMRRQVGLRSFAKTKMLDFGCGVRFSQAIINNRMRIGRYVGVDIDRAMIDFLRDNVGDRRFEYHFLDTYHALYNPGGRPLSASATLPVGEGFDLITMFSVITHQTPDESRCIFRILRRHVGRGGVLYFTCFLDEAVERFEDRSPGQNGGFCVFNRGFLLALVEECGWQVAGSATGEDPLIGDSFVLRPG